jgi:hypothetical protein
MEENGVYTVPTFGDVVELISNEMENEGVVWQSLAKISSLENEPIETYRKGIPIIMTAMRMHADTKNEVGKYGCWVLYLILLSNTKSLVDEILAFPEFDKLIYKIMDTRPNSSVTQDFACGVIEEIARISAEWKCKLRNGGASEVCTRALKQCPRSASSALLSLGVSEDKIDSSIRFRRAFEMC